MLNKFKNKTLISEFKPIEFEAYDNEELALIHMVKEKASSAGRKNSPDQNSKRGDANEHDLHQKIEMLAVQATHRVMDSTESLRGRIDTLSITEEAVAIDEVVDSFKARAKADITPKVTELESFRNDAREAEEDLLRFKQANGLRRAATYPESNTMALGIIILCLALESIANSFFFAEGSNLGFVGGWSIAITISAVNILFGFLVGKFVVPFKNHISEFKKYSAYTAFVTFTSISILMNLGVAHYRDAIGVNPDNADILTIELFSQNFWVLSGASSWLLFFIGFMFYILAFYKGYNWDDHYPGYGRESKNKNRKVCELLEFRDDIFQEIDEVYQEYNLLIEDKFDDIKRKQKVLNTLISSFENQISIYKAYINQLKGNITYLISVYRDTNLAERESAGPEYFNVAYDKPFNLEIIKTDYSDKRDHLSAEIEVASETISSKKSSLLEIKNSWHNTVDEVAKI
jgi:hypothetical protein